MAEETKREADRLSIEVAYPMRVQYSTIRIRIDHSLNPNEDPAETMDSMAARAAEFVAREMETIELALKPVTRGSHGDFIQRT